MAQKLRNFSPCGFLDLDILKIKLSYLDYWAINQRVRPTFNKEQNAHNSNKINSNNGKPSINL